MNEVYLIGGMALVTFAIRYAPYATAGRITFPPLLERALRYVPPAVLTAIVVPAVLIPGQYETIQLSLSNPYLIGAVAGIVVMALSRNLLLTIVLGMGVFLGWQWLWPLLS